MAYENFIPTLWAEGIERDLERICVFKEDCNTKYEGRVKKVGDTVRIFGVGKPTIYTMDRKNASGNLVDPEEVDDTSITLAIKQIRYFNFLVGDFDEAQAIPGVMEALRQEASEGLADEIDKYIASFAMSSKIKKLYGDKPLKLTADKAVEGEINVLHAIDAAAQALYENDVKDTTEIVLTVTPRFFTLFRRAYIGSDTNNSEMLKTGRVAQYGNIKIKQSNNVARSADGSVDHMMIRTKRAIAFANPLTSVEAYRPEKKFADAVKGYSLFDAVEARPKEVIDINVTY